MLRSIRQQATRLGLGLPPELRSELHRAVQERDLSTLASLVAAILDSPIKDAVWLTWLLARLEGGSETQAGQALWTVIRSTVSEQVAAEAIRGLAVQGSDVAGPELSAVLLNREVGQDIRLACAYALGHSGSEQALPALISVLKDKGASAALRGMSAEAIGLVGKGSVEATYALIATLDDDAAEVVVWAAYALAALGAVQAIPALRQAHQRTSQPETLSELETALSMLQR